MYAGSGIVNFPEQYPSLFKSDGRACTEGIVEVTGVMEGLLWCDVCLDGEDVEDCESCGCRVRTLRVPVQHIVWTVFTQCFGV